MAHPPNFDVKLGGARCKIPSSEGDLSGSDGREKNPARRRVIDLRTRHGSLEAPELGPLIDEARRRFGDERVEQIAA